MSDWNGAIDAAAKVADEYVGCDTISRRIRALARSDEVAHRCGDMLEALEKIAQWQRGKCEHADAETLFMLLDNKVSIARAAIRKAGQCG